MDSYRICVRPGESAVVLVRTVARITTGQGRTVLPMVTPTIVAADGLSVGVELMQPGVPSTPHRRVNHEVVVVCLRCGAVTLLRDDLASPTPTDPSVGPAAAAADAWQV